MRSIEARHSVDVQTPVMLEVRREIKFSPKPSMYPSQVIMWIPAAMFQQRKAIHKVFIYPSLLELFVYLQD